MPSISNELRAALWTALYTFLGLFVASTAGWVEDVIGWASTGGVEVFPDVTVVGKAAVSAAGAAFVGLVNWAWRKMQSLGVLPGNGPVYPRIEE